MICQSKPINKQAPKDNPINSALALQTGEPKVEDVTWSPFTAGPYLVPVTRWVE